MLDSFSSIPIDLKGLHYENCHWNHLDYSDRLGHAVGSGVWDCGSDALSTLPLISADWISPWFTSRASRAPDYLAPWATPPRRVDGCIHHHYFSCHDIARTDNERRLRRLFFDLTTSVQPPQWCRESDLRKFDQLPSPLCSPVQVGVHREGGVGGDRYR